ncbi:MAG TPA: cytochrome c peroxidase, partial [Aquabacterium sp.]|nr:cytochrome c peroxidase [Aquabacterium sp.]
MALATLGLSVVTMLAGCGGGGSAASVASGGSAAPSLSALAAVGEQIFHDPSLSKHHNQACASCHVAEVGHAGPLSSGAVETGSDGHSLGSRVAPSLRYLAYNRAFRFDAGTPTGGFFWDGRAATLAEQAKGPLLNPAEMANDSVDAVISQLAQSSYAPAFKALFGDDIFTRPTAAFEGVARALQAYQQEDADFAPFSSKYDAFLRGQAQLSAQELRGLLAFNSSSKGNCAACHPSGMGATGGLPLFTDFSYDVLGV